MCFASQHSTLQNVLGAKHVPNRELKKCLNPVLFIILVTTGLGKSKLKALRSQQFTLPDKDPDGMSHDPALSKRRRPSDFLQYGQRKPVPAPANLPF